MLAGGQQGYVVECSDAHDGGAPYAQRLLEIRSGLKAGSWRQHPRQVAEIDQSQSEATAIRESEKVSGRYDGLGGFAGSSRQGRESSCRRGVIGYQCIPLRLTGSHVRRSRGIWNPRTTTGPE